MVLGSMGVGIAFVGGTLEVAVARVGVQTAGNLVEGRMGLLGSGQQYGLTRLAHAAGRS